MRCALMLGVGALTLAACQQKPEGPAAATGEAPAATASVANPMTGPPRRKAGLWTQTVTTQGMTQTSKICLDEATEAKMTVWGQQMNKDLCPKNEVTPGVGGWSFSSECNMGAAGKISTSGNATGDFNSSYVVKATSVTTGSSMAQANGTHEMEMKGSWEGPCPAGMKPGDMTLPGGMTVNLNNMPAMK
jgi:hypothetical protein